MIQQSYQFDPVQYAKECIQEKVNEALPIEILYATINMKKLVEITGYSESYLRQNFTCTKEAKKLECGTTSKYLWKYPEIRDCWRKFCDQNNIRGEAKEKSKKLKEEHR